MLPLAVAQQVCPFPPDERRSASPGRQRQSRRTSASGAERINPAPGLIPSSERQELLCSVIGLSVKLGLSILAGLSLMHLAGAYQQRLDRHGELSAILDIEQAKLRKAQERFDQLFTTDGERRLIREQDQWIAPNRLRIVWNDPVKTPRPNLVSATASPSAPQD